METIHVKSVDPVSQELLRSAASLGVDLTWERYETLQPQDGFLRLGLSCPFGCLQGPCRIDPFGRGAARGICGLERDAMVAAMLLRLALQGALEALGDAPGGREAPAPAWPASLEPRVARALESLGGATLSANEVFASAALLSRPAEAPEGLIRQALRLGVLTLGLAGTLDPAPLGTAGCRVGYGLLAGSGAVIGVCGGPPRELVDGVLGAGAKGGVRVVSLGDWIAADGGFLPFACTSGEAELALSSGRVDLLLAGPRTDPSVLALARRLEVPVVASADAPKAKAIVSAAAKSRSSGSRSDFDPDAAEVGEGTVVLTAESLAAEIAADPGAGFAVLGGWDTPQQSMGWVASEVAQALAAVEFRVAGFGDAALWMVKGGLGVGDAELPVRVLEPVRGPLVALEALGDGGGLRVCYTGLSRCRNLAEALGLASLGARVCIACPIPLWGSAEVRDGLAGALAAQGGSLAHFDHPAEANEVLAWLRAD